MKTKLLLCFTLVLTISTVGSVAHTYSNTNLGFQLEVPDGWSARETAFYVAHYSRVFLTINSQRPALEVHDWKSGPNSREFGDRALFEQMQPGEVYVSIGYASGPMHEIMRSDTVDGDLMTLLATNRIASSSQAGLSCLNLRFFKRGYLWFISANLKEPVKEEDRQKVMAMLESFRFLVEPVGNAAWAESLAWKELPDHLRPSEIWLGWPTVDDAASRTQSAQTGLRKVVVEPSRSGFSVQFIQEAIGTWDYLVTTNGGVQAQPPAVHAVGVAPSQLPSDLPGACSGGVDARWIAPYVRASTQFGKTTVTWLGKDGRVQRQALVSDANPSSGFVLDFASPNSLRGINEDWHIALPHESGPTGSIEGTADSRIFIYECHPQESLIALDVYIHGKRVNRVGPFTRYRGSDVELNTDGSAALLVAEGSPPDPDSSSLRERLEWSEHVRARVAVLSPKGRIQFQADCGPSVCEPIPAPGGAGVLIRPNTGGTNQNTFTWVTAQGKTHSLDISPNPWCIGWIPESRKSLFSFDLAGEPKHYELIDWDRGKPLWNIVRPGSGDVVAVGLTPDLIIFSVAEPYHSGDDSDDNEWMRTFYAVSVQDGSLIARWQSQLPHRSFAATHDYFLRLGEKLFYVTRDEFSEINLQDIRSHKHGWR